jgi:D-alanyl-D-alanine carboxypeptidase (penicillin-binding protein 5/6)
VILDNLELSQQITIPNDAVGIEGSSLYLKAGEVLTVEDLLYGMMLRSGNDAATALALAVSGNVADFAKRMNERAKECGAYNSNFVNPHGLHHKEHYTTAYDLALITAEAMKYPYFRTIIMSQKARIGDGESRRIIANKNKLLHMYDGANGVKTGFTKNSGRCLVSSAKRNGMQLIAVVLNHGDMWGDSMNILDYGFDTYEMVDTEMLHLYGEYGRNALDDILNDDKLSNLQKYPVPKLATY